MNKSIKNLILLFSVQSLLISFNTYSSSKDAEVEKVSSKKQELALWRMGSMVAGGLALGTTAYLIMGSYKNNDIFEERGFYEKRKNAQTWLRVGSIVVGAVIGSKAADIGKKKRKKSRSSKSKEAVAVSTESTNSEIMKWRVGGAVLGGALAGVATYFATKGLDAHWGSTSDIGGCYEYEDTAINATGKVAATLAGMALGTAVCNTDNSNDDDCEDTRI